VVGGCIGDINRVIVIIGLVDSLLGLKAISCDFDFIYKVLVTDLAKVKGSADSLRNIFFIASITLTNLNLALMMALGGVNFHS